jgi:hypothetical protein
MISVYAGIRAENLFRKLGNSGNSKARLRLMHCGDRPGNPIVNLKEADGSMVVASHQERDVKGKLVEQVTTANAGMKSAASLRAGM